MRVSIFTCIFFLALSVQSNAQFSKGMRMAGASIANIVVNSGTSEHRVVSIGGSSGTVKGYNINLSPSLGWFITDKAAVGVTLAFNPSKETTRYEAGGNTFQSDEISQLELGLGGFLRNYFKSGGSLLPFAQVNLNGGITNTKASGFYYGGTGPAAYKQSYDSKSSDGFFMNAIFSLGGTWMVSKNIGLDLTLGYNYSYNNYTMNTTTLRDEGIDGSIEETGTNETRTRFSNNRFIFGIGFQVFLDRKK